jgi:glycosyltransferase involved in cell wall biosynthesis
MKTTLFVREVIPEGGVALATFRLATTLVEAGGDAEVLYCAGEPPADMAGLGRRIGGQSQGSPRDLRAALEEAAPQVIVIGSGEEDDLRAAREVAPTVLHAHLHMGTCADASRYWYRLKRPCAVKGGWKCTAIRPVLGCNELRETLKPSAVARQQRLLALLKSSDVGVLCVSTDQAELYIRHGMPQSRVACVPNLGIRMGAEELGRAAQSVPEEWRSAIAFVGRLSKTKGGELLPQLHSLLSPSAHLRVFGEGYLGGTLSALPPSVLCGHVSQEAVAGILMWARALVFPSLWPEPGGIVGIDAQVMGVPLAAFDIGAGRHWPAAERFDRTDLEGMACWLDARESRSEARDAAAVAAAQARYWQRIGVWTRKELTRFGASGEFAGSSEPVEALMLEAS